MDQPSNAFSSDGTDQKANGTVSPGTNGKPPNKAASNLLGRQLNLDEVILVDKGGLSVKPLAGDAATVDLYCDTGKGMLLRKQVKDEDLKDTLNGQNDNASRHILRICLITTPGDHTQWERGNHSILDNTTQILRGAGMSSLLLNNIRSETCYWAKMGDQRFLRYDKEGHLEKFEICYQFRHGWNAPISFVHMIRTPSVTTYFCVNYPQPTFARLRSYLEDGHGNGYPDSLLDALAADVSSKKWLVDIGIRRDDLRMKENKFDEWAKTQKSNAEFKEITPELHRLSRDWVSMR
ncbi:hypothetical protein P171DRAFT_221390 [Karstenula rhodostoma CBS 690.94]|uniref:Uncharacterized protein n=1 Tax=Karstenula rhodostoma CBS 690.94 TaxID=1392251 RepID=A0A9P4PRK1_9PLEO|nr:hypothetical protein P171DRAFT_221390 [Karstenula rhodostoma CBS 690.94]